MRLDRLDHFPADIGRLEPQDIKQVFLNPTLISIEGAKREPLFVSTLLHGNELTSFEVLQHLQRNYAATPPPRSLLIYIGNVDAASQGVRRIDGTPDHNRIWGPGASAHHAGPQEVIKIAREQKVFANIDIHNNTGANPYYGCISVLRPADLQLAAMFAPVGVYYLTPNTTQSIAFSKFCPSITLECGQNGDVDGLAAAIGLVEDTLRLDAFAAETPGQDDLKLYQTVGRVVVDPDCSISFGDAGADLKLRSDLQELNFTAMQASTQWATTARSALPIHVFDDRGMNVTDDFFHLDRNVISLKKDVTPAMVTPDLRIIRQDCLCYLMAPLSQGAG